MNFRKATAADAQEILELTHIAFMRYANEVGKPVAAVSETLDDVLNDIETKDIYIAIEDDKIVGAIRIKILGEIAYLSRFCAVPAKEGLHVGKDLMDLIKNDLDVQAICLHTSTKLYSLVIFYYRCGFYVHSVSHDRGYPRGLFVCKLTDNDLDYEALTKDI